MAAQVALAVVLLAHLAVNVRVDVAGLASDVILETPEIVTAALSLPASAYPTAMERTAFYDTLLERLHGLPAVDAAAVTTTLPDPAATLGRSSSTASAAAARTRTEPDDRDLAGLLRGDWPDAAARPRPRRVERAAAVVNQQFVDRSTSRAEMPSVSGFSWRPGQTRPARG